MLPSTIKAEVKLTTGSGVAVAARELDALAVTKDGETGLLAVLFVGGDRDLDGGWSIVDAAGFRRSSGDSVCAARSTLVAMARSQPWLDELRRHVDELWPAFLQAFVDVAEHGHSQLVARFEEAHRAGTLREHLPHHKVLAVEHRRTVHAMVERHGESDAGRLVQDLLAYLLVLAGYHKVTLNPVGVPDFVLEGRATVQPDDTVTVDLARGDMEKVVALCRTSGDERLARAIEAGVRSHR